MSAMPGVNKAILIGNLGSDAELKYTPNGNAVSSFAIATTENWKNKNGEKQTETQWHNIVLWNKAAEAVSQYLKKGRTVYVEGKITSRTWEDKDGNKRSKTEIVASIVQLIGGDPDRRGKYDDGSYRNGEADNQQPQQDQQSAPPPVDDDSLPF
jgi:single-strand DNA-binding protein